MSPSSIFDGLPDIFTDAFGEAVDYTPAATGLTTRINAIWTEGTLDMSPGIGIASDEAKTTLSLKASDFIPVEGDRAVCVKTGRSMEVTTPILPDGKGMIVCNLVEVD